MPTQLLVGPNAPSGKNTTVATLTSASSTPRNAGVRPRRCAEYDERYAVAPTERAAV